MRENETIGAPTALADETRLKVYRLLEAAGEPGLPAGELATKLGVPSTSLSNHLDILARAGVISQERQGRSIVYRSRPEKVQALARILVDG